MIIHPSRVIDYPRKFLETGIRNILLNCWSGESQTLSEPIQAIAIAINYLPELESKSLLLETHVL